MKVAEFMQRTGLKAFTGDTGLEREITGIYVCDLLSWVMSHASKGDAWITVHTHLNIVAVALLAEVSCIIVPEGIKAEEATVKKAAEEGIVILGSEMSAYHICCKAYELLR
ncbi:MAG: AraC family transcriptional regulator [Clostridia bacterium]|nr:AraC family transcriptional regulator [Clostridia bacterium]